MAAKRLEYTDTAIENLKKGAFLTVKSGDKINTMTIGWGFIGFAWGKNLFEIMVRKSRYTHKILENADEFTVSIPLTNEFKSALGLCGTKSGRDIDKVQAANLELQPGRTVSTPVIKGNMLQYECKIIYRNEMKGDFSDSAAEKACYEEGDYHTLYHGEIVDFYKEDQNV
ncbi:flavin reductase family protein [Clostridium oryzae]|uniref:Flavin reductase like domain protein n=1 Tax=Clostridium oryzae TaxID=1450648 RepID=A0A1V4IW06_9CLOT|nr:flavin reductase family protein [Clostridium oryzae]OPJ63597.1 flavin reductase like domain protein [Clostridium oryzae]